MERKLVKQGRNALTMTLPSDWVKQKGLSEKDYVYVTSGDLLIVSSQNTTLSKEIELDLSGFDLRLSYHYLNNFYISGYDVIKIKHDSPEVISEICANYIGMVFEQHTSNYSVLKNIIRTPEDNFHSIFRRITSMLVDFTRGLRDCVSGEKKSLYNLDWQMDDMILYCMRYLNKYEFKEEKSKYFLLLSSLESIGDYVKRISKNIGEDKKLAEELINLIEKYVQFLLLKDIKGCYGFLRKSKLAVKKETFLDGVIWGLIETMYNYMGYLVVRD